MSSEQEPNDTDLKAQSRNAFALILAKLGRRDHTEKELERALGRKGYSEEATAAALRRAKREGLVDDERLAGTIARINARS
ncbi:MAG TPA: recombination regulator RecX, partial [Vicinamibacteria bacterium]|nr:recombination regulator RecX [Vicinamibacteria bacterium]